MQDYEDRAADTAYVARIDTFIGLAEDGWKPELLSRQMETVATLTTASDGSVALPSDYYRPRAIYATINGVQTNLPMIGPTAEQGLYPITTGDTPNFARIMGTSLYVVPEQVLTVTMDYWAKFVGLSATNTTNWIIQFYPSLYFYSVMEQGCLWLKDWSGASNWANLANSQFDDISNSMALEYFNNTDLVLDSFTP